VHLADEWDRTPMEPARKLSYLWVFSFCQMITFPVFFAPLRHLQIIDMSDSPCGPFHHLYTIGGADP